MKRYAVLLRGINVGGNNKVPMARLKVSLETLGFSEIVTYIASGNVVLASSKSSSEIKRCIERMLPSAVTLNSELIKVLVLSQSQLEKIVKSKPAGFGDQPTLYHSDVVFLIDIDPAEALSVFDPRPGVDQIWLANGVIYSQRLSAQRTKSRLNKIVGTKAYRSMTIRTWNTTVKLGDIIKSRSK